MNNLAPIGHNNPPDPIDAIIAQFDAERMESENWADGTPVQNEAQMNAVDSLRKSMRSFRIALEGGQKSATAPLYDAYKTELARWKPTIDDAGRIEKCLTGAVDGFKKKLAAEKAEAERKAREEAYAAKRAAEEAARQAAQAETDIEAQRAAAEAQAAANDAWKHVAAAAKDVVKGMRTVHKFELVDGADGTSALRLVLLDIAKNDRPALEGFLMEYVRQNFRLRTIDGVRSFTEKEAY